MHIGFDTDCMQQVQWLLEGLMTAMVYDTLSSGKLLAVDFGDFENVAQINWCLESYISGPRAPLSFSMGPI
jgi:hypothetical protein